jgi:hypothetical protein
VRGLITLVNPPSDLSCLSIRQAGFPIQGRTVQFADGRNCRFVFQPRLQLLGGEISHEESLTYPDSNLVRGRARLTFELAATSRRSNRD